MFQDRMQAILSGITQLKYMVISDVFQFWNWPFGNQSQWLCEEVLHGEDNKSKAHYWELRGWYYTIDIYRDRTDGFLEVWMDYTSPIEV